MHGYFISHKLHQCKLPTEMPLWWRLQAWFSRRCAVLVGDTQSIVGSSRCWQQDCGLSCCYQQSNASLKISLASGSLHDLMKDIGSKTT